MKERKIKWLFLGLAILVVAAGFVIYGNFKEYSGFVLGLMVIGFGLGFVFWKLNELDLTEMAIEAGRSTPAEMRHERRKRRTESGSDSEEESSGKKKKRTALEKIGRFFSFMNGNDLDAEDDPENTFICAKCGRRAHNRNKMTIHGTNYCSNCGRNISSHTSGW